MPFLLTGIPLVDNQSSQALIWPACPRDQLPVAHPSLLQRWRRTMLWRSLTSSRFLWLATPYGPQHVHPWPWNASLNGDSTNTDIFTLSIHISAMQKKWHKTQKTNFFKNVKRSKGGLGCGSRVSLDSLEWGTGLHCQDCRKAGRGTETRRPEEMNKIILFNPILAKNNCPLIT